MSCWGSGVSSPKKAQRVSGTFPPVPKHLCCDAVSWLSADWCPLKLKPPGRLITLRLPAVSSCLGTLKNGRCWRQHYRDNLLKNTSTSIQNLSFCRCFGMFIFTASRHVCDTDRSKVSKLTAPVFAASIASANRSTSGPYGTSGAHWFCEWCLPLIPSGDPVAKAPFSATCRGSAAAATWTAWTTTVTLFRAEWSRLPWARSWKIHLTPLTKNYYCQIRI